MKTLAITTLALAIAFSSAAEAKHHGKKHNDNTDNSYYVGDPVVVYHEIGTSGSQNGNTIVHPYGEPVRSQKPYEVRYDYQDYNR